MSPELEDLRRRQRWKNVAVACGLFGLVALFFLITLVKLGGGG
jgi:hypothetical protein